MATFVIKPVNARGGSTATFGVKTDLIAPWKYQWKRNGVNMGGAHWASMTTPPLVGDDFKAKYSVTVYGQDSTETSDAVMLDAVPPPAAFVAGKPIAARPIAGQPAAGGPPPPPPPPPVKK